MRDRIASMRLCSVLVYRGSSRPARVPLASRMVEIFSLFLIIAVTHEIGATVYTQSSVGGVEGPPPLNSTHIHHDEARIFDGAVNATPAAPSYVMPAVTEIFPSRWAHVEGSTHLELRLQHFPKMHILRKGL